ncbi:Signal peptidase I [Brachionus plicatilis]|uniref:Signal peptidase I n=1 Tax=Brachionus plicatilis TaxID=10195 RepID=A0A3M7SMN9_BRAPC|nr:Signal peptidase I [Brachionus plicatilis]
MKKSGSIDQGAKFMIWLEWTFDRNAQVIGLSFVECSQLDIQMIQWYLTGLGPQLDLGQNLIGERIAHDKARVTMGTSQIDQSALGQNDHVATILQLVSVHLRLNGRLFDTIFVQPFHIQLTVKVTNVAQNGIVVHCFHMSWGDDSTASGRCDKDAALWRSLVHCGHLVAFHRSLQGIDGVNFGDDHSGTE